MYTAQLEQCDREHQKAIANCMMEELARMQVEMDLKADKAVMERIKRIVKQATSLMATQKTIMGY